AAFVAVALTLHLAARDDEPVMIRVYEPALAGLPTPGRIPADHLMVDQVCAECHADISDRRAGTSTG
ncbi:MAG: hypothetical protein WBG92_18840, partial [Thiohalocapsa sp.]